MGKAASAKLDYEITGGRDHMRVDVIYPLRPEEIAELEPGKDGLDVP